MNKNEETKSEKSEKSEDRIIRIKTPVDVWMLSSIVDAAKDHANEFTMECAVDAEAGWIVLTIAE